MNNSTDTPAKQPLWGHGVIVFSYILYPVIVVTSTIGNGLVCLVIYKRYKRRALKNYYVFLLNLAIADMLFAWVTVPMDLLVFADYGKWPYTDALCPITYMLQNTSYYTSIFTLAVISLARYQGIVYPFKRILTNRRAAGISLFLWAVSAAARLPEVLDFEVIGEQCGNTGSSNSMFGFYMYTLWTFLVPFGITLVAYILIGRHLKSRVSHDDPSANAKKLEANKRVVKMLILGASAFAACVFPFHIAYALLMLTTVARYNAFWDLFVVTQVIGSCHCLVNPICYTLSNKEFRKEVYRALVCTDTSGTRGTQRTQKSYKIIKTDRPVSQEDTNTEQNDAVNSIVTCV